MMPNSIQEKVIEYVHHSLGHSGVPSKPGEFCAIDLYGSLPTSMGGVRYLLVCLDVFSKYVKLYPLKSATTKSCLNKLINHYFVQVTKPNEILSDNGTQFQSPAWKRMNF
jgi:transposase InsO family protein